MSIVSEREDGGDGQAQMRRPPRWKRLWTLLCSGLLGRSALAVAGQGDVADDRTTPKAARRRMRIIGLSCLGVALAVVLVGVLAGGFLGAVSVNVFRKITASDPLIATEAPIPPRPPVP